MDSYCNYFCTQNFYNTFNKDLTPKLIALDNAFIPLMELPYFTLLTMIKKAGVCIDLMNEYNVDIKLTLTSVTSDYLFDKLYDNTSISDIIYSSIVSYCIRHKIKGNISQWSNAKTNFEKLPEELENWKKHNKDNNKYNIIDNVLSSLKLPITDTETIKKNIGVLMGIISKAGGNMQNIKFNDQLDNDDYLITLGIDHGRNISDALKNICGMYIMLNKVEIGKGIEPKCREALVNRKKDLMIMDQEWKDINKYKVPIIAAYFTDKYSRNANNICIKISNTYGHLRDAGNMTKFHEIAVDLYNKLKFAAVVVNKSYEILGEFYGDDDFYILCNHDDGKQKLLDELQNYPTAVKLKSENVKDIAAAFLMAKYPTIVVDIAIKNKLIKIAKETKCLVYLLHLKKFIPAK